MTFFLKTSPAVLFSLLLTPVLFSLIISNAIWQFIYPFVNLVFFAVFLGWIYSVGNELGIQANKKSSSLNLFRICITITLFFCLFASFYQPISSIFDFEHLLYKGLAVIVLMAVFYCFYFVSNVLVSMEKNRNVSFNEHRLEFFLFFFFIVEVWVLQPRIRAIVKSSG
jgi:hypothetical protein